MEFFWTILTGVLVFVTGQIIIKLIVNPIQEFKRTIADIAHILIEYANIFGNPGSSPKDLEDKVSLEIRNLSSKLNAQFYLIPFYTLNIKIFNLPTKDSVFIASKNLIGLSNGFNPEINDAFNNMDKAQLIKDCLKIYTPEHERK